MVIFTCDKDDNIYTYDKFNKHDLSGDKHLRISINEMIKDVKNLWEMEFDEMNFYFSAVQFRKANRENVWSTIDNI